MRLAELGLDKHRDWQKYYEIELEEEKRFDKKFKRKKQKKWENILHNG